MEEDFRVSCVDLLDGRIFVVSIALRKSVSELKDVINERRKYTAVADDIELFLAVREGDAWLGTTDPMVKDLRRMGVSGAVEGFLDEELDPTETVGALFAQAPTSRVIHVFVKPPQPAGTHTLVGPSRSWKFFLDLDFSRDEVKEAYGQYLVVAGRLKKQTQVTRLVDQLERVIIHEPPAPFVVLENSSGTGKTQMAFTLDATERCEVFFLVCADSGDKEQLVYDAFNTRSETFQWCVREDMGQLHHGSIGEIEGKRELYLYGFIAAALDGRKVFTQRTSRAEVLKALERRRTRKCKRMVFFLDEFPRLGVAVGSEKTNQARDARATYLRTMRNVFRSFRLPVVISSTNGTARNLFSTGDRSRQGLPYLWCVLFPSLPHSDLDGIAEAPGQLQPILLNSRPLFAAICLQFLQRYPPADEQPVTYLNYMVAALAQTACDLKKKRSEEFELGQLGLFLCTSFKLTKGHANLIDSHFAQLQESESFDLVLNATGEKAKLSKDGHAWECRCVFPSPTEDVLLHLAFTGCMIFKPLKQPLHEMMESDSIRQKMYWSNVDQSTNDGMALEALVSAAVVLASHCSGFGGVSIPVFLGKLLFELGVTGTTDPVELPTTIKNAGSDKLAVPFLSPPNIEWPEWLVPGWQALGAKFDNFRRTTNQERVDFTTESGMISGECKDHSKAIGTDALKEILARVPGSSLIHFVVTRTLQDRYFTTESAAAFLTTNHFHHTEIYRVAGPRKIEVFHDLRKIRPDDPENQRRVDQMIVFIEVGDDVWDRAFLTPL